MSPTWAICLDLNGCKRVGSLRCVPGIEACATDGRLWLRGSDEEGSLQMRLRCLPEAQLFAVLPDGQLILAGRRVPTGRLPAGPWVSLASWLTVELPHPALGGQSPGKLALRVEPSTEEERPNVLLTTATAWLSYASEAPQVRLDRWTFAQDADGRVAVRGWPSPPIIGTRYVERQGVAVQAGWAWTPRVAAEVVHESLQLSTGDLALLHDDGTWDFVAAEQFVRATRSAIRLSCGATTDER